MHHARSLQRNKYLCIYLCSITLNDALHIQYQTLHSGSNNDLAHRSSEPQMFAVEKYNQDHVFKCHER